MSIREEILQEQRERFLEALRILLENDVENVFGGDSPLGSFGISIDDIWDDIMQTATLAERDFVKSVLEITHHVVKLDPDNKFIHTLTFVSLVKKWAYALVNAKEIKGIEEFNEYYGIGDYYISLGK